MTKYYVTTTDDERRKTWLEIFGTNRLELEDGNIRMYSLEGEDGLVECYRLKLDAIPQENQERLIAHIKSQFDQTEKYVRSNIRRLGIPIPVRDIILEVFT